MSLTLFQVDSFTDRLFSGNPAGVIVTDHWPAEELMQNIGLENNLSETAFVVKEEDQYGIRWFTPEIEVDLCGHATLAAAHVLFEHLRHQGDKIIFNSRSGLLPVVKIGDVYQMDFPTDTLLEVEPTRGDRFFGVAPVLAYKGREDYLLIFDSEETVRTLVPDLPAIRALDSRGVIATGPGEDCDFVSRCFFPAAGIDEDPVTGSAHTTLAPYWSKKLGKNRLEARQISSRGGVLECAVFDDRVLISGKAVTYMQASLFLKNTEKTT